MADNLKNVALVGASGNLGSEALGALLKQGKHNITVITRSASKSTYPSSIQVKRGDYKDYKFLESALQGQDVLVIMLGFAGLPDQDHILEGAAKAGVKYILPSDYGAPAGDDRQVKAVPLIQEKRDVHDKIESLGMKWIGVVTGSWVDYSLTYGTYDILAPERKANVYEDSAKFKVSTIPRVAAGIARLLALPATQLDKEFGNDYFFVSSFHITHPELFAAVLRATGTSEADWEIQKRPVQALIDQGHEMLKAGDFVGNFKIIYGNAYKADVGGDYSDHNHVFGLDKEQEDLDEVVKAAVEAARPGGWSGLLSENGLEVQK